MLRYIFSETRGNTGVIKREVVLFIRISARCLLFSYLTAGLYLKKFSQSAFPVYVYLNVMRIRRFIFLDFVQIVFRILIVEILISPRKSNLRFWNKLILNPIGF